MNNIDELKSMIKSSNLGAEEEKSIKKEIISNNTGMCDWRFAKSIGAEIDRDGNIYLLR